MTAPDQQEQEYSEWRNTQERRLAENYTSAGPNIAPWYESDRQLERGLRELAARDAEIERLRFEWTASAKEVEACDEAINLLQAENARLRVRVEELECDTTLLKAAVRDRDYEVT